VRTGKANDSSLVAGNGEGIKMHAEIAFANERAIIADMLISLLTNLRLTYLPDLEPADAHELLLTGGHVLIAQLASQPATASEISRVIGRPRDVVIQRLDELVERGYVEHRGNRYKVTVKLNVPNLRRHMQSNISIIQAAAKQLAGSATQSSSLSRVAAR
jgi:hypothetical protein